MSDIEYISKKIQIPNIEELQKKAEQGDKDAQFQLAELYVEGTGIQQNYKKAFELYEKSSKQGNTEALFRLGIMYYKGRGIEKNIEKATEIFNEAIGIFKERENEDDKKAEYFLGYAYEKGLGVEQNYYRAEVYYSVTQSDEINAITRMGYLHEEGLGVIKDIKFAKYMYECALEAGDIEAVIRLGYLYDRGELGDEEYAKAKEYYEVVAKKGVAIAKERLGSFYLKDGNYEEGIRWLKEASEQGVSEAKIKLGYLYERGLGVEENYIEASRLYKGSVSNEKEEHYGANIIDGLNGRKVLKIDNISEILEKDIDEDFYGAIAISPNENMDAWSHTLYSIDDIKKIKKRINQILENVDMVKDDKSNELEVFMQIYTKLGKLISYDYNAIEEFNEEDFVISYTSRNMVDGLLYGECVCAGYAEILRNVLACRGIKCIYAGSEEHAYNQVQINGKWYYTDLTWDRDRICEEKELKYCLKSQKTFNSLEYHKNCRDIKCYEAPDDYPYKCISQIYDKILKNFRNEQKRHTLIKLYEDSDITQEKVIYAVNNRIPAMNNINTADKKQINHEIGE